MSSLAEYSEVRHNEQNTSAEFDVVRASSRYLATDNGLARRHHHKIIIDHYYYY